MNTHRTRLCTVAQVHIQRNAHKLLWPACKQAHQSLMSSLFYLSMHIHIWYLLASSIAGIQPKAELTLIQCSIAKKLSCSLELAELIEGDAPEQVHPSVLRHKPQASQRNQQVCELLRIPGSITTARAVCVSMLYVCMRGLAHLASKSEATYSAANTCNLFLTQIPHESCATQHP